jgi:hypothetical protein
VRSRTAKYRCAGWGWDGGGGGRLRNILALEESGGEKESARKKEAQEEGAYCARAVGRAGVARVKGMDR